MWEGDTDELIERISEALQEMPGEELAEFYNTHFGDGMSYLGDSLFCQDEEEEDNET